MVIEITFDEIIGGRPTSDGGGGQRLFGSQWVGQFLNDLGKAVRLGSGWRDPVRGSGEKRKPIGCRTSYDDPVDGIFEFSQEGI